MAHEQSLLRLALIVTLIAVAAPGRAQAQPDATPVRDTVTIGVGWGPAAIASSVVGGGFGDGMGIWLQLGILARPDLALVLQPSTSSRSIGTRSLDVALYRLGVMYWLRDRVWLGAGGGLATIELEERMSHCDGFEIPCDVVTYTTIERHLGGAATLGAGVELYQRRSFVLDVRGEISTVIAPAATGQTATASLAFCWY